MDDSGGKVYILGGDTISREKKNSYEHASNSEQLPRQRCLNLKYKVIVIKREKLLTVTLI